MKLLNFKLDRPYNAVTIIALDQYWDLHCWATFRGFKLDVLRNSFTMEWWVDLEKTNPWGNPTNQFSGCRFVFNELSSVQCMNWGVSLIENEQLISMAQVDPKNLVARFREKWLGGEQFNLLFEFGSGATIEVASDSVVVEAINVRGHSPGSPGSAL